MDIINYINTFKEIGNANLKILNTISENIKTLEESFNNIIIVNIPITYVVHPGLILSLEKVSQKKFRYRFFATFTELDIKKPLSEFRIKERIEAYQGLQGLLEEIYNNQSNVQDIVLKITSTE